jgi:hypothetical protein
MQVKFIRRLVVVYSYLGAFLPVAEYNALNGAAAFNTPNYPGNVLAAAHGGTGPQITDALRAHKEQMRQFDMHQVVMQALRKQIIDTIEEKYIMSLRNKYT